MVTGRTLLLGGDSAYGWVAVDGRERPTALGVRVGTEVPGRTSASSPGPLRLPLPRLPGLAFDHAEIEWHPYGHPPRNAFAEPHLDVRFLLVDSAARTELTDTAKAARIPPLEALPAPYVPLPRFLPGTGAYWIDPTAAPFTGGSVGGSIAYGYYDGKMVFMELKLDTTQLRGAAHSSGWLALPERLPAPGAFPTHWSATGRGAEVRIALENLRRVP